MGIHIRMVFFFVQQKRYMETAVRGILKAAFRSRFGRDVFCPDGRYSFRKYLEKETKTGYTNIK